MPLILRIAKEQHTFALPSTSPCQKRERRRLQKAPRRASVSNYEHQPPSPFSDSSEFSAPPSYYLTVSMQDEKAPIPCSIEHPATSPRHVQTQPTIPFLHDAEEIFFAELECPTSTMCSSKRNSLRTRSKTPVFAVGQLERRLSTAKSHFIPLPVALEDAELLAQEYQSILPIRAVTPFVTKASCEPKKRLTESPPRTIRKIKHQHSLRSLANSSPTTSEPRFSSDADTLLDLDSPLASPGVAKDRVMGIVEPWVKTLGGNTSSESKLAERRNFSRPFSFEEHSYSDIPTPLNFSRRDSQVSCDHQNIPTCSSPGGDELDDVGLNICLSMLTDELATAFSRQETTKKQDHTSDLQILLMIEAYEAVQKQLREQISVAKCLGEREKARNINQSASGRKKLLESMDVKEHPSEMQPADVTEMESVRVLESILDQWLEALYTLYEARENGGMRRDLKTLSIRP